MRQKNTLTVSKKGGIQTILGSCCGLLIHTFAAVIGLSAIIVKSAYVFAVLKYVGAVYLCYLGVKTLWTLKTIRSLPPVLQDETQVDHKYAHQSCFKQGFLTNIMNPKVAVFFLNVFTAVRRCLKRHVCAISIHGAYLYCYNSPLVCVLCILAR